MDVDTLNCSTIPQSAATDAGVAGTGVLLSFIITAGLALLLSAIIIFHELRRRSEARVSRKLLLSFSDQQIITGIGIQSIGLARMNSMIPYHFFIIWMMSLLSTATHLSALLALVNDFKRDWVLRWLRQFLMFVNLVLSCTYGIFVLRSVTKGLPSTLPIACVWQDAPVQRGSNVPVSVAGTIAVIAANCIVFIFGVWYLHSKRRWFMGVQVIGLLALIGSGLGAAIRVILLSQAFGNPSVNLKDDSEKTWNFGQLLSLLMLLLPLVSAVEVIRGEIKVPPPVADGTTPPSKEDRHSFQPNPFWGSHTDLVRR